MITKRVSYEWDCETCNDEDVLDHNHGTLADVLEWARRTPEPGQHFEVVLVRDVWEFIDGECDGLVDRQWAYVKDGRLPINFTDGAKVPERFHKELTMKGQHQCQ